MRNTSFMGGRAVDTQLPEYLTGIAQETGYFGLSEREALTAMPAVVNAAIKAFNASGLIPAGVDVTELMLFLLPST